MHLTQASPHHVARSLADTISRPKKKRGAALAVVVIGWTNPEGKVLLAKVTDTEAAVAVHLTLRGVLACHFSERQPLTVTTTGRRFEFGGLGDGNPLLSNTKADATGRRTPLMTNPDTLT